MSRQTRPRGIFSRHRQARLLAGGLILSLTLDPSPAGACPEPVEWALRPEAKQEQTGKGAGLEQLITSLAGLEEDRISRLVDSILSTPEGARDITSGELMPVLSHISMERPTASLLWVETLPLGTDPSGKHWRLGDFGDWLPKGDLAERARIAGEFGERFTQIFQSRLGVSVGPFEPEGWRIDEAHGRYQIIDMFSDHDRFEGFIRDMEEGENSLPGRVRIPHPLYGPTEWTFAVQWKEESGLIRIEKSPQEGRWPPFPKGYRVGEPFDFPDPRTESPIPLPFEYKDPFLMQVEWLEPTQSRHFYVVRIHPDDFSIETSRIGSFPEVFLDDPHVKSGSIVRVAQQDFSYRSRMRSVLSPLIGGMSGITVSLDAAAVHLLPSDQVGALTLWPLFPEESEAKPPPAAGMEEGKDRVKRFLEKRLGIEADDQLVNQLVASVGRENTLSLLKPSIDQLPGKGREKVAKQLPNLMRELQRELDWMGESIRKRQAAIQDSVNRAIQRRKRRLFNLDPPAMAEAMKEAARLTVARRPDAPFIPWDQLPQAIDRLLENMNLQPRDRLLEVGPGSDGGIGLIAALMGLDVVSVEYDRPFLIDVEMLQRGVGRQAAGWLQPWVGAQSPTTLNMLEKLKEAVAPYQELIKESGGSLTIIPGDFSDSEIQQRVEGLGPFNHVVATDVINPRAERYSRATGATTTGEESKVEAILQGLARVASGVKGLYVSFVIPEESFGPLGTPSPFQRLERFLEAQNIPVPEYDRVPSPVSGGILRARLYRFAAGMEEWPGFLGPADFGRIAVWLFEQLLEGPLRQRRDQITLPEVIRHIQTAAESGRDSGYLSKVSKERVTFFIEKLPFLITGQPEPPAGAYPKGYELTRFFNFFAQVETAVVELWQEDKIHPEMASWEMADQVLHRFFSRALSNQPMELGSAELNLHLAGLFMTPEEQKQATYRVLEVLRLPPPAAGQEAVGGHPYTAGLKGGSLKEYVEKLLEQVRAEVAQQNWERVLELLQDDFGGRVTRETFADPELGPLLLELRWHSVQAMARPHLIYAATHPTRETLLELIEPMGAMPKLLNPPVPLDAKLQREIRAMYLDLVQVVGIHGHLPPEEVRRMLLIPTDPLPRGTVWRIVLDTITQELQDAESKLPVELPTPFPAHQSPYQEILAKGLLAFALAGSAWPEGFGKPVEESLPLAGGASILLWAYADWIGESHKLPEVEELAGPFLTALTEVRISEGLIAEAIQKAPDPDLLLRLVQEGARMLSVVAREAGLSLTSGNIQAAPQWMRTDTVKAVLQALYEGRGLEAQNRTGLEEEAVAVVPVAERVEDLISGLSSRGAPEAEGAQPLRIFVDTNRIGPGEGDSQVLRLAELGIRLKLEGGLHIEVAGMATEEGLQEFLAQFSGDDEKSRSLRELLSFRIFIYQAGDRESHETARMLLGIAFPEFEGVKPITTVDERTVQWFLAGLEELGVLPESFTPEFQEQIRSFLTSRHAA